MSAPLVSFVVPSYNYSRYLGECLDSVLSLRGGFDLELVVVDDGSSDGSQDVIRRRTDPRVRAYFHKRNLGHVATINEGFALARGRYVARIDSDDRYLPHFLETTIEKFEKYPEVGMVYGDARLIDSEGRVTQERGDWLHGGRDWKGDEYLDILKCNFVPSPTVIARREVWEGALPIPEGLSFSDWYLSLRIARFYELYFVAEPLADYRVHAQNLHTKISMDRSEESSLFRILDEHFASTEKDSERVTAKRRARPGIYAAHYRALGDKYFGFGMNSDARRCYLRSFARRPAQILEAPFARRFAAAAISRRAYEKAKALWRGRPA